jgi:hypothetical protein
MGKIKRFNESVSGFKYKIKLFYTTGNSYNSERTSDYLELEWNDLSIAKENLQRIKDHYKMQSELERTNWDKRLIEFKNVYSKNPWFVLKTTSSGEIDDYYAMHCIKLKADNGNEMQMSCFWIGHFETLHGGRIETNNSDMEFRFD